LNESFIAYIDESGDEGFKFNADRTGSSEWFVLSAVVVRARNDVRVRDAIATVRTALGKPVNFGLHFRNLKHEQRIPYVEALARVPIRAITVMVHKPSLRDPETFRDYRLYHYCVRLLLERVSWLCRDEHRNGHGDGSAKIIFSNRSAMSYTDLRKYVARLISSGDPLELRIDGSVIEPEQIIARPHGQYAGLQAADAVASSFYFAVQTHRLGFTEPRYVNSFIPVIYRNNGRAMGHGIKLWSRETDHLLQTDRNLRWVTEFFEKKLQAPGSRIPPLYGAAVQ
jgi:hypothetical protein